MSKKNLLILFGGQSSEHAISCMSAMNVIKNVDQELYNLVLVGITESGHWVYVENLAEIESGSWKQSTVNAVLSPDATKKTLYLIDSLRTREIPIDVAFPVLHGLYGEDGTVQGIFELARIPYVGCGVLSSAISMDKIFTKIVVEKEKIRQAKYVAIHRSELSNITKAAEKVEASLPYPVFVKPSCAGSSCGVNKAVDRESLIRALREADHHDSKILVEETIVGRELECAVFGTSDRVFTTGVGEIIAAAEFYDFDAKYNNSASKTETSPDLPEGVEKEIQEKAEKVFRAVGGFSMARVDFFLDKDGVVFNEINTIPGFTAISMYPMLFEKMGYSKKQLVQDLIATAACRREH